MCSPCRARARAGLPTTLDEDLAYETSFRGYAGSWVDRLPTATARWLLVTGSGSAAGLAFAPPLGALIREALGAADFIASACDTDGRRAVHCSRGPAW